MRLRFSFVVFCVSLTLGACAAPEAEVVGAACDARAAELVVSEFLVAPQAVEAGRGATEWIEIYNPTERPIILDRVVLTVEAAQRQVHEVRGAPLLEPGAYMVFAREEREGLAVGYSYGNAITLPDDGAIISLHCRETLLDTISYGAYGGGATKPGASLAIDGGVIPSAASNDTSAAWCTSTEAYDGVNLGTPGAPNTPCGALACRDELGVRENVHAAAGDLVITEVFARSGLPQADFGNRDWLELYNLSDDAIDLNGLTLVVKSTSGGGASTNTIVDERCLSLPARGYAIVSGEPASSWPSSEASIVSVPGLQLFNTAPQSIALYAREELVDYAEVEAGVQGKSWALEGELASAAMNDLPEAFCVSEAAGFFDERGTPGQPNLCGPLCLQDGALREVRPPRAGSLWLTEVFANPSGADNGRDFVEVYAAEELDLNGLSVTYTSSSGARGSWTIAKGAEEPCVVMGADSYAVLGGPGNEAHGVELLAAFGRATEALLPSNPKPEGDILLQLALDGELLDEISYPQLDDPTRPQLEGHSYARWVAPGAAPSVDDPWCMARTAAEGFYDVAGSPGVANLDECASLTP